jgi:hypothetical protein
MIFKFAKFRGVFVKKNTSQKEKGGDESLNGSADEPSPHGRWGLTML